MLRVSHYWNWHPILIDLGNRGGHSVKEIPHHRGGGRVGHSGWVTLKFVLVAFGVAQ